MHGFVDLQVNGLLGIDFSSEALTSADILTVCETLERDGTAAFLPTLITAPEALYARNLPLIRACCDHQPLARRMILGIHLEGPFIDGCDGARGAHPLAAVRDPDPALLERLIGYSGGLLRLMTVAAGRPGTTDLIRHACRSGVRISLGHHLADGPDIHAAAAAGASLLTHLGNGLPHTIARHRNPLWPALVDDRLSAMVIADGQHVPDDLLQVILRSKGPGRVIATSDASPVAGLPPGLHRALGRQVRITPDGRVEDPDTGYLVGSACLLGSSMARLHAHGLATSADIERLAIDNPLAALGLTRTALAD